MHDTFAQRLSRAAPALLLMLFAVATFTQTFGIEDFGLLAVGAEAWPRILAVVLFLLSGAYLVVSLKGLDDEPDDEEPADGEPRDLSRFYNPAATFILFFVFLLLLPKLGMLFGLLAFAFAMLVFMGEKGWRAHGMHALIALALVGSSWAIFTYGLRIFLPASPIFGI